MESAADKFGELEERILRAIEMIKSARMEKEIAEKQLRMARVQIEDLDRELGQLKRERDLVRTKVESLVETLSELTEESLV